MTPSTPAQPTLILIPCLSGAAWDIAALSALSGYAMRTLTLNDAHTDIESHADDVLKLAADCASFVLVGDSFGAQVALAAAARRPKGLHGLVMSGGFAANPVTDPITKLKAGAAALLPGPLYREIVLPMHAQLLHSRFDAAGEIPWSSAKTLALFREHTPWAAYVRRTRAALSADYRAALGAVNVPTLILTPEDDTLIGPQAAQIMRDGIAGAEEVILPHTGHMFRFSHPAAYSNAVAAFLTKVRVAEQGIREAA